MSTHGPMFHSLEERLEKRELQKRIRAKQLWRGVVCSMIFLGVVGLLACARKQRKVETDLPATVAVSSREMACRALKTITLRFEVDAKTGKKKLVSEIQDGTDKLAIKICDRTMTFMTAASIEVGYTEGAAFDVLLNDEDRMLAVYVPSKAVFPQINSFVLEKRTGLATWTKNRTGFLDTPYPEAQTFYLVCQ